MTASTANRFDPSRSRFGFTPFNTANGAVRPDCMAGKTSLTSLRLPVGHIARHGNILSEAHADERQEWIKTGPTCDIGTPS